MNINIKEYKKLQCGESNNNVYSFLEENSKEIKNITK